MMHPTVKAIAQLTRRKERLIGTCLTLQAELAAIDREIQKLAEQLWTTPKNSTAPQS